MKIAVVGTGYVGLVTGVCFAETGNDVTCIDIDQDKVNSLKAGKINALVVQNPHRMGYLGVKTIVQHIRGETVEKRIDTGATLVTMANFESDEIQELLGLK